MNKEKYLKYLESIDIKTDDLINRIGKIHDYCQKICPDKFEDIFIDEYINEGGARVYEEISFFSGGYVVSAPLFSKEDECAITKFGAHRFALVIKSKDYDFEKATGQSRLSVERRNLSDGQIIGWFKASKENCDTLMNIIKKYAIPIMMP
jgi:hypothetical protein